MKFSQMCRLIPVVVLLSAAIACSGGKGTASAPTTPDGTSSGATPPGETTPPAGTPSEAQSGGSLNALWTRQIGASGSETTARGIAVDAQGTVYVTGVTRSSDGTASPGVFVVKYDSAGTAQWTRQITSSGADEALGVAVDAAGNIYAGAGGNNPLVVKYNPSGEKQWEKRIPADRFAADAGGNSYVVSRRYDSDGKWRVSIEKLSPTGTSLWKQESKPIASAAYTAGVAVDAGGDALYASWLAIGTPAYGAAYSLFVAKYDATGTKQWTEEFAPTIGIDFVGITADTSGNVFARWREYNGKQDGKQCLAKYDPSGAQLWTKQTDDWDFWPFTIDQSGNTYSERVSVSTENDGWTRDRSIAKYDPSGTELWTKQIATSNYGVSDAIAVDGDGNLYIVEGSSDNSNSLIIKYAQ